MAGIAGVFALIIFIAAGVVYSATKHKDANDQGLGS
jgi:hypothetical protein